VIPLKSEGKCFFSIKVQCLISHFSSHLHKLSFIPNEVSQFNVITTPAVLSAFTTAIAAPSVDSLSERFAATFVLLRRFRSLNRNLHLLQPKLSEHIIPAPVLIYLRLQQLLLPCCICL
jgi:hypothetical protein